MTNPVNAISPANAAPQTQTAAPAAAPTNNASATASSFENKPLVGSSNTPISPRIVVDPLAGVITEFLTETGQVQSQIPSAAVVAYLRAGLTSSGQAKQTPETQNDKANSNSSVVA